MITAIDFNKKIQEKAEEEMTMEEYAKFHPEFLERTEEDWDELIEGHVRKRNSKALEKAWEEIQNMDQDAYERQILKAIGMNVEETEFEEAASRKAVERRAEIIENYKTERLQEILGR